MIEIKPLAEKQAKLDKLIEERVQKYNPQFRLDSVETVDKIKFAFKVELSELANEVGFFKYWKQSHEMDREKVLEEWADCLHFLLSVSNLKRWIPFIPTMEFGTEIEFFHVDGLFYELLQNPLDSSGQAVQAFLSLFALGLKLGYTEEELIQAYYGKYAKNIARQKEGY